MSKCQCQQTGCICKETNVSNLFAIGHSVICGCCMANCPDVHPDHETNDHPLNRYVEKLKSNE